MWRTRSCGSSTGREPRNCLRSGQNPCRIEDEPHATIPTDGRSGKTGNAVEERAQRLDYGGFLAQQLIDQQRNAPLAKAKDHGTVISFFGFGLVKYAAQTHERKCAVAKVQNFAAFHTMNF